MTASLHGFNLVDLGETRERWYKPFPDPFPFIITDGPMPVDHIRNPEGRKLQANINQILAAQRESEREMERRGQNPWMEIVK